MWAGREIAAKEKSLLVLVKVGNMLPFLLLSGAAADKIPDTGILKELFRGRKSGRLHSNISERLHKTGCFKF